MKKNIFLLLLVTTITYGYYGLLTSMYKKQHMKTFRERLSFFRKKHNKTINDVVVKREPTNEDNYNLNWYVVGKSEDFKKGKLEQVNIWDKKYVVWRENTTHLHSMDNHCSHRGASLSLGKLTYSSENEERIVCPYHGYEFDNKGTLCKIPGIEFTNTNCHNQMTYPVVQQDGWIYMNVVPTQFKQVEEHSIFREPEAADKSFSKILLDVTFNAPARLVSENSLDLMHIGFVHTFGNRENPNPICEIPPFLCDYKNIFHYKTIYEYNSGEKSLAKKVFKFDNLTIENEFILPHTTVARIIFGDKTSTVITIALPQNNTHTKLFVKTYRNYWNKNDTSVLGDVNNYLGDLLTKYMMEKTVVQDKDVVENIDPLYIDGKYNMKYDKLQNVYRSMYTKHVKNITDNKISK